ncbi:hypothetical protein C8Q80DRAFT_1097870 [Daedaleopsis nitida]|nr:hypothetical protein C8Q80DRAFT_1097870 [Daedaleopsis nitida]
MVSVLRGDGCATQLIRVYCAQVASANHINDYFARYPRFNHDPAAPFLSEFRRLARQLGWEQDSRRLADERRALQNAMVLQFNAMYGRSASDLGAWQSLCRAIGISPVPESITKCRKILKITHVNLVDFVHRPDPEKDVRTFANEFELSRYTINTKKFFPRRNVNAGSLLKTLLRNILRPAMGHGYKKPAQS